MKRIAAALGIALLAACAQQPPVPASVSTAPKDFPFDYYRRARPVFAVDPARSLIVIIVRRDGRLARLGHDHVVAARDVIGFVAPGEGRADLYLQLDRLTVDEPALRAEVGLDTQPSAADIEGTRSNMLGPVLEADRHPFLVVQVREPGRAAITLHGVTRHVEIPMQIEKGADEIAATGRFEIRQSDFGIVPLAVLGGAIQVRDLLEVRFSIRARRAD